MNFVDKYEEGKKRTGSRLIVGLDPVLEKLPAGMGEIEDIGTFVGDIVEATRDVVLGYKPNIAFFGQYGPEGMGQLEAVSRKIRETGALFILDTKRGDIGNTNKALAREIFDHYGADATTLNPLLGITSLGEFTAYDDRYMFVLNFTSNPDSEQFFLYNRNKPLYQEIADRISECPNCGAVAGATKTEYLREISVRIGDSLMLVPGIGAQGGSLERSVEGIGEDKFLFTSTRSIIYASSGEDYPAKAREKALEYDEAIRSAMAAVL